MMAQAEPKRKNVMWTDADREAVALRAYEHHMANSETESWMESLQDAQSILMEPDNIKPRSSLYSDSQKLKELGARLYREKQAAPKIVAQISKSSVEGATTSLGDKLAQAIDKGGPLKLVDTTKPEVGAVKTPEPVIHTEQAETFLTEREFGLMDLVVDQAVRRIGDSFREKLRAMVAQVTEEVFTENDVAITERKITLPAAKTKIILPTVLIVGMLPKHATELKKEYQTFFDLEFVETDKVTNLKAKAAHKDRVIINTSFINNQVWDTVRSHPGLILAAGNNIVKDKLLELACNTN